MSNAPKVTMLLYCDLSPTEQQKLEAIDAGVAGLVVNELRRTERAMWTSGTDDGQRFIRLCLADLTVLFQIKDRELATISTDVLLSQILASVVSPRHGRRVGGLIGCFGLESWWLSAFSDGERKRIEQKYQPLGSSGSSLTSGDVGDTNQTALGFLHTLAGWFSKEEERPIAHKVLEKADDLRAGASVLDLHFLFGAKVDIYYKDRDSAAFMEKAIRACKEQIELAPQAAAAFKAEYEGEALPSHKGYEQLAIILEKDKKFEEALALCARSKAQGWSGDWDKRIERCKKKLAKA